MRYVIVKYSASACNKELLDFLKTNIARINKQEKLKVVIVYSHLTDKLQGKIKTLPVMVSNGTLITGVSSIISELSPRQIKQKENTTNLQDFWKEEMISTDDNDDENIMDIAKNKTFTDMNNRRNGTRHSSKANSNTSNNFDGEISSMDSDPIMKKFWANQEYTPGTS